MARIRAALVVTAEDKAELERMVRCGKTEQRVAFRSRIVLAAAEGMPNTKIAEELGTACLTAYWAAHRVNDRA